MSVALAYPWLYSIIKVYDSNIRIVREIMFSRYVKWFVGTPGLKCFNHPIVS